MTSDRIYRPALPVERAWAELRAHSGTQFDPEIVEVFGRVVDEQGLLRSLDVAIESNLEAEVHVPFPLSASDEWQSRLAMLPVLEPLAVPVKARAEPCPVAPVGEICAVVESGEGCEIVVPVEDGADTGRVEAGPAQGGRQVA
jgi:hypothetical protein